MYTKADSDISRVIFLPILKRNKIPNSAQFSYWLQNVASNLDKATSFYGFTMFRYIVREGYGHEDHTDLAQDTAFVDHCKVVARLEGKHFDEDN